MNRFMPQHLAQRLQGALVDRPLLGSLMLIGAIAIVMLNQRPPP